MPHLDTALDEAVNRILSEVYGVSASQVDRAVPAGQLQRLNEAITELRTQVASVGKLTADAVKEAKALVNGEEMVKREPDDG